MPRLSMSEQTRLERKMEFARCIALVVYGICGREVHLIVGGIWSVLLAR
jgi:hypothetical protein